MRQTLAAAGLRALLPMLAPAFNRLLRIDEGSFGRSPKAFLPSNGALRAQTRLLAHRKATAARLANVDFAALEANPSRQVARAAIRAEKKTQRRIEKLQARRAKGLRPATAKRGTGAGR